MANPVEQKNSELVAPADDKLQPDDFIYDSPPPDPDDEMWLEYGRKLVHESLPAARAAANSLLSALGVLVAVYLGVIGFAKFIPENLAWTTKILFFVPLVAWVIALFLCLKVAMTELTRINIHSPDQLRDEAAHSLEKKQRQLETAFALLVAGLLVAFALILFRFQL